MMSATMMNRVKGLIKEHVPLAKSVAQWMKSPLLLESLHGPIPRPSWMPLGNLRESLSREFINGSGIEIGALYNPVFVKPGVVVTYVDWETTEAMREQVRKLPHQQDAPIVTVDIVDDGATLTKIENASQDFIIANHFIEHVQNPIGTIKRHLELLKPGGILYYGIPDKRFTFDKERPVTTMEHLIRDHEEGPAWSLIQHVEEFVTLSENKTGLERDQRIEELLSLSQLGIHFHVWTIHELTELFTEIRKRYSLPYVIEAIVCNRALVETLCVLRKTEQHATMR